MCAVKLDMVKAYDRVEWNFLMVMMERMGFSRNWINIIRWCIQSMRFPVKLNGGLSEAFIPSRGMRQGGPLSPYLFLFCVEGFSALIKAAQQDNRLNGVSFGRDALTLHICFLLMTASSFWKQQMIV